MSEKMSKHGIKEEKKDNKKNEKVWSIICVILLIIVLPILLINIVILVKSYTKPDEIPSFMGYKPFIVLSGSMEKTIMTGDIAISKETDASTLKIGDIISFRTNDNIVVTHRIINITTTQDGGLAYQTQGDNNYEPDQDLVIPSKVEGVFIKKLDGMGNYAMTLQQPWCFITVAAIPVLVIVITQIYNSRQYKKELEELRKKASK